MDLTYERCRKARAWKIEYMEASMKYTAYHTYRAGNAMQKPIVNYIYTIELEWDPHHPSTKNQVVSRRKLEI